MGYSSGAIRCAGSPARRRRQFSSSSLSWSLAHSGTFGRFTNVKLQHLATRYEARLKHEDSEYEASLELAKLRKYEASGVINKEDATQLADQIARRDVVGGRRPGRPRGPYKKKQDPPAPPPPSAPGATDPSHPQSPAV